MKPQLVNWQIAGGMDEKTSSPWADLPDTIRNMRYAKTGELMKRWGLDNSLDPTRPFTGSALSDYSQTARGVERLLTEDGLVLQKQANTVGDYFQAGATPNIKVTATPRRGDAFMLPPTGNPDGTGKQVLADICLARSGQYRVETKLIPSKYTFTATDLAYPSAYTLEVSCYNIDSDVLAFAPVVLEDCVTVDVKDRTCVRCIYSPISDTVQVFCLFPQGVASIKRTAVEPWNGTASTFSIAANNVYDQIDFDVATARTTQDGTTPDEAYALFYSTAAGEIRYTVFNSTGTFDWRAISVPANTAPVAISGAFWRHPSLPTRDFMSCAAIFKRTSGAGAAFVLKLGQGYADGPSHGGAPPFNWYNFAAGIDEQVLHSGNTGATPDYPVDYYTGCVVKIDEVSTAPVPYSIFNSQNGCEWHVGILTSGYAANWPMAIRNYTRCAWAIARPAIFITNVGRRVMLPMVYRYVSTPQNRVGTTTGLLVDITSTDTSITTNGYLVATFAVDQLPCRGGRTFKPTIIPPAAAAVEAFVYDAKQPSVNPSTTDAQPSNFSKQFFVTALTSAAWMGVVKLEETVFTMRFTSPDFVGVGGRPTLLQDSGSGAEVGFIGQAAPVRGFCTDSWLSPLSYGVYQYIFVWAYVDAQGRRQQSVATQPYAITVTGGGTARAVGFFVPTLDISARDKLWPSGPSVTAPVTQRSAFDIAYLEVYRTEKDGGVFYFHSQVDTYEAAQTTGNELTEGFYFYDDKNDVDVLDYSRQLDQTLFHYTPPCSSIATKAGKRYFCVTPDGQIWPSDVLTAVTAPKFDITYAFYWDQDDPVTAVAEMDGKYYFFTANSIWVTAEDGRGGLVPFEQVASDIGCISQNSCLTTPIGLFFECVQCVALISRGGQVIRIGVRMEETQAGRHIDKAILVPDLNEARFFIRDDSAQDVLIFDYRLGTPDSPVWYSYSYDYYDTILTWALTKDKLPVLVSAGSLAFESRTSYRDGATFVSSYFRSSTSRGGTPVTFLGGLSGTVQLGGLAEEQAGVTLTLYSDYRGVPLGSQPLIAQTWSAAEIAALPRRQLTITSDTDVSEACALAISYTDFDEGTSTLGRSYSLSGAVLRLGQRTDDDVIVQPEGSRK